MFWFDVLQQHSGCYVGNGWDVGDSYRCRRWEGRRVTARRPAGKPGREITFRRKTEKRAVQPP